MTRSTLLNSLIFNLRAGCPSAEVRKKQLSEYDLPDYQVLAKYNCENYNNFGKKIKRIQEKINGYPFYYNNYTIATENDKLITTIDLYSFLAKRYYLHNPASLFTIPEEAKEYNISVKALNIL